MAGSTDRYHGAQLVKTARPQPSPAHPAAFRPPLARPEGAGRPHYRLSVRGAGYPPAMAHDPQAAGAGAGGTIRFQARRFLPPAAALPATGLYAVRPGDRIDLIAARLLGNPLLYWMIADANDATDVPSLCRPGARLRIPVPTADIDATAARGRLFATGDAVDMGNPD